MRSSCWRAGGGDGEGDWHLRDDRGVRRPDRGCVCRGSRRERGGLSGGGGGLRRERPGNYACERTESITSLRSSLRVRATIWGFVEDVGRLGAEGCLSSWGSSGRRTGEPAGAALRERAAAPASRSKPAQGRGGRASR